MIHTYYLFLLVLTASGSVIATLYGPKLIARIKQYFTRFKRELKPAIDATTYFELLSRIEAIEKRLDRRQVNFKQRTREEVRAYLEEIKTK